MAEIPDFYQGFGSSELRTFSGTERLVVLDDGGEIIKSWIPTEAEKLRVEGNQEVVLIEVE